MCQLSQMKYLITKHSEIITRKATTCNWLIQHLQSTFQHGNNSCNTTLHQKYILSVT